jgi:hypothetical protein
MLSQICGAAPLPLAAHVSKLLPAGLDRYSLGREKEKHVRRLLLILCVIVPLLAAAAPASAADDKRVCFPQVPNCIEFRFREFWNDNGGLAVFGLPLTADENETVGDQKYKVQYFERARLEYHKGDPEPYDMLLGRLGADRLAAQGRDWQTFPKGDPKAPHYFAETGHAIAPQFWGFWSRNGLEFDGNKRAKSMAESLALFGFPISEAQMEPGSDGNMYLTQWFERARFEYHPENKAPYDVLLGLLGADVLRDKQAKPEPSDGPGAAIGCPENALPVAEGAQAWMANTRPAAPDTNNTLCARLTIGGASVAGAEVSAVVHFNYGDVRIGPATTGADGQAQIDFNIGKARHRSVVAVEVQVKAADGTVHTALTNFRPIYSFEEPPPVSGPVLENIPAPTGNCVQNALPPVEGAQAWVTNYQPTDPNQFNSICARLIVNGQVVQGAEVNARAYLPSKEAPYGPAFTDASGVAELGFPVAGVENRYVVYIDVEFKAADGKTYNATTYYRPNYPTGS